MRRTGWRQGLDRYVPKATSRSWTCGVSWSVWSSVPVQDSRARVKKKTPDSVSQSKKGKCKSPGQRGATFPIPTRVSFHIGRGIVEPDLERQFGHRIEQGEDGAGQGGLGRPAHHANRAK